jgi:hypothetical protein
MQVAELRNAESVELLGQALESDANPVGDQISGFYK